MKYNFSSVQLLNINGEPIDMSKQPKEQRLYELLANYIYTQTKDLALVKKAMDIHAGKEVEIDKVELTEVKRLVNEAPLTAFAKKAILDYIESVK